MNYNELRKDIVVSNQLFKNFTGRYLLPQIKLLEPDFLAELNACKVVAFGLCDRKYERYNEYDNKLFILISMRGDLSYWYDNYEHYIYQDNLLDKLMIIIDLPINNRNEFLQGDYSKLYTKEAIDLLFPKYKIDRGIQILTSAYSVLKKMPEARESFENKVNKDFNLNPKIKIDIDSEYEYPPVLNREIFNYA